MKKSFGIEPNFILNKKQLSILQPEDKWDLHEIAYSDISKLPEWMKKDCIGIMASGDLNNERILHGIEAVAGFDWLRIERKPKKNEKEGNAYHFIIKHVSGDCYHGYGPYRSGMRVEHRFDAEDIEKYNR